MLRSVTSWEPEADKLYRQLGGGAEVARCFGVDHSPCDWRPCWDKRIAVYRGGIGRRSVEDVAWLGGLRVDLGP